MKKLILLCVLCFILLLSHPLALFRNRYGILSITVMGVISRTCMGNISITVMEIFPITSMGNMSISGIKPFKFITLVVLKR